jgi:hypothetical protein
MKVDLYLNGQLVDGVAPNEVIALTRQAAKWNDIITRNADFSNVFSLMKTRQLMQFFGHPDEVGSLSEKPYRRASYELRVDDVPISSGFAQLEEVGEMVEVQLFSGIADFFDLLGDLSTVDLDLTDLDHRWTFAQINARKDDTSAAGGICYPAINYRRMAVSTPALTEGDYLPGIYGVRLLNQAAAQFGYTVQGVDNRWFLPFSQRQFIGGRQNEAHVSRTSTQSMSIIGAGYDYMVFNNVVFDPYSTFGTAGNYGAQAHVQGTYKYEIGLNLSVNFAPVDIVIVLDGVTEILLETVPALFVGFKTYAGSFNYVSPTGNTSATLVTNIRLAIKTAAGETGGSLDLLSTSYWKFTSVTGQVLANGWIDAQKILKPIKLRDLFINYAITQCALIVVDNVTGEIRFVRLDDILKTQPLDWSGYIDETKKPEVVFSLGDAYGQRTLFPFLETDETDVLTANFQAQEVNWIDIDSEVLPPTTEAVKPFFGAAVITQVRNPDAPIPVLSNVPEILRFSNPNTSYLLPDITPNQKWGVIDLVTDPTQARFVPYTWENLIDDNYQALQQMLTRTKVVKLDVWLPMHEFINFDPMRPVFLLGQKWFVRKINQYKLNETESTEVELIRL